MNNQVNQDSSKHSHPPWRNENDKLNNSKFWICYQAIKLVNWVITNGVKYCLLKILMQCKQERHPIYAIHKTSNTLQGPITQSNLLNYWNITSLYNTRHLWIQNCIEILLLKRRSKLLPVLALIFIIRRWRWPRHNNEGRERKWRSR